MNTIVMTEPKQAEHWYDKAARIMVSKGVNLFAATQELDLGIRSSECESIVHSKEFQAALRAERNRFYKEIASDPARSRNTAVGQLLFAIERMIETESYDKAANAIIQLAKIEGWTNDNAGANLFFDLSGKDLAALKNKVKAQSPSKMN